jgi:hypothetical protein
MHRDALVKDARKGFLHEDQRHRLYFAVCGLRAVSGSVRASSDAVQKAVRKPAARHKAKYTAKREAKHSKRYGARSSVIMTYTTLESLPW